MPQETHTIIYLNESDEVAAKVLARKNGDKVKKGLGKKSIEADAFTLVAHTDDSRKKIGDLSIDKLAKKIADEVKDKTKFKKLYLISCEAGFANKGKKSLAKQLEEKLKEKGLKAVQVYALENPEDGYGMHVEVITHAPLNKSELGNVRGVLYKTQKSKLINTLIEQLNTVDKRKKIVNDDSEFNKIITDLTKVLTVKEVSEIKVPQYKEKKSTIYLMNVLAALQEKQKSSEEKKEFLVTDNYRDDFENQKTVIKQQQADKKQAQASLAEKLAKRKKAIAFVEEIQKKPESQRNKNLAEDIAILLQNLKNRQLEVDEMIADTILHPTEEETRTKRQIGNSTFCQKVLLPLQNHLKGADTVVSSSPAKTSHTPAASTSAPSTSSPIAAASNTHQQAQYLRQALEEKFGEKGHLNVSKYEQRRTADNWFKFFLIKRSCRATQLNSLFNLSKNNNDNAVIETVNQIIGDLKTETTLAKSSLLNMLEEIQNNMPNEENLVSDEKDKTPLLR